MDPATLLISLYLRLRLRVTLRPSVCGAPSPRLTESFLGDASEPGPRSGSLRLRVIPGSKTSTFDPATHASRRLSIPAYRT